MFKNKLLLIIILYVGSYCIWSRIAMQQSQICGIEGEYFFMPEPNWQWRAKNYFVVMMYYPLIFFDNDFCVAREPSWQLQCGD